MTSWSDVTGLEAGADTGNSSRAGEYLISPQTRRAVLSSLLGTMSVGALGTELSSAAVFQDGGDETAQHPFDGFDWKDWNRPHTQLDPGPTDQHCPPTTLTENWASSDLADGTTGVQIRPESPEEEPVYAFGNDLTDPTGEGKIYGLDRQTGAVLDGWPLSTDGFPIIKLGTGNRLSTTTLHRISTAPTSGSRHS